MTGCLVLTPQRLGVVDGNGNASGHGTGKYEREPSTKGTGSNFERGGRLQTRGQFFVSELSRPRACSSSHHRAACKQYVHVVYFYQGVGHREEGLRGPSPTLHGIHTDAGAQYDS